MPSILKEQIESLGACVGAAPKGVGMKAATEAALAAPSGMPKVAATKSVGSSFLDTAAETAAKKDTFGLWKIRKQDADAERKMDKVFTSFEE